MNKKLEMNPYLKGLKEIFIKHGIDEAYTEYKFTNTKDDGVILHVDGDREALDEISAYIDNHALGDDGAPPELYSFALRLLESDKETAHCIYKDGVFYE